MKSHVLEAIRRYARTCPDRPALQSSSRILSYAELACEIEIRAEQLRSHAPRVLGLMADNGIDWVLADLAAMQVGVPVVPLPTFFSQAQLRHTIWYAGIDLVLTDQPAELAAHIGLPMTDMGVLYGAIHGVSMDGNSSGFCSLPSGTQKITFTSGTTGFPKGVCLSTDAMETVALSLFGAINPRHDDRHLCVLPLVTLLENIAGVYVPLLAGAVCMLLPLSEVGLTGSSGLNVHTQLGALERFGASSAILVPQMLTAQVAAITAGVPRPRALRYLAVGGGCVSPGLLSKASALGLPVIEGYGLSECASVVALNRPDGNRQGSVGKPLSHVHVKIAEDGEILVSGAIFSGYLGDPLLDPSQYLATGDVGYLDADGYLYVTGRKKNMFITSFGRNVSPEWVESELLANPALLQAAVFGEARPFNIAVIVPHPATSLDEIGTAIKDANKGLPDYAQIVDWIVAKESFSVRNGQLTPNGRLRRSEILKTYSNALEALYKGTESDVVLRRIA
jgi:long-chain acyl-CoA synthetase